MRNDCCAVDSGGRSGSVADQERSRSRGCGWWTALITRPSCRHANQDLTRKCFGMEAIFHVDPSVQEPKRKAAAVKFPPFLLAAESPE
ncbi:hypothetical protein OJAV_G00216980 [Oryzias javanicus]|uniref:Uncharacterized protein n=1 Tax=Oryzias javanicus TaxID=123683 RepID=A0A3S2PC30_ORYJA|nr:hypothetical protein OJAV_G00216980 [Oryzias javanicus]